MGLTVYGGGGKPEEEKTVTAGTSAIEVLPSSGKVMKKVTVNPTPTESKEVTAGTEDITVSLTDGKHLSGVTVHPTPSQEKTVIPTADGFKVSPDIGKLLSAVFVDGDSDLVGENIKQGVNIFGVDGSFDNSHGAYVWKKAEIITPTATLTFTATSTTSIKVTSPDIDLTAVDASYFAGISGTLPSGTVYKFVSSTQLRIGPIIVNYTYDSTNTTLNTDDFGSFITEFTYTKEGKMGDTDFVVSDSPTAYPDGGVQDGYWYEKAIIGGCKTYSGSITLASVSPSIEISNPFGKKDKVKAIFLSCFSSNSFGRGDTAYYNVETETTFRAIYAGREQIGSCTITNETITITFGTLGGETKNFDKNTYSWEVIGNA